ncbi:MAG: SsrA-binding protein SmpB [Anaerolineales bacterium]|nr:SsrA-binding protein SmpB [Anaerolineales bacterium]
MAKDKSDAPQIVASNRKAAHDYFLEERLEAGLALVGTEIKSIRAGKAQIKEAYVRIENGQATLLNAHIATYDPAARFNHDPLRPRRLLLHKKEIRKLGEQVQQKGYTLIPVKLYLVKGRAKLEIALARGKKDYDKRASIAKRDAEREMRRELGRRE